MDLEKCHPCKVVLMTYILWLKSVFITACQMYVFFITLFTWISQTKIIIIFLDV